METPKIYAALSKVAAAVGPISKDRTNSGQ